MNQQDSHIFKTFEIHAKRINLIDEKEKAFKLQGYEEQKIKFEKQLKSLNGFKSHIPVPIEDKPQNIGEYLEINNKMPNEIYKEKLLKYNKENKVNNGKRLEYNSTYKKSIQTEQDYNQEYKSVCRRIAFFKDKIKNCEIHYLSNKELANLLSTVFDKNIKVIDKPVPIEEKQDN